MCVCVCEMSIYTHLKIYDFHAFLFSFSISYMVLRSLKNSTHHSKELKNHEIYSIKPLSMMPMHKVIK
jgi:hypothetical protein